MAEGYVAARTARLFYRTVGRGPPLVFLHGGPGANHRYFLPWVKPLAAGSRLVFYDQRGGGRSTAATDRDYGLGTMVSDLEVLRKKLGLGRINLLGHSWGGMLALEYALRHPASVRRLILADTFTSGRQLNARLRAMRRGATPKQRAILSGYERRGLFRHGNVYPEEYGRVAYEVYAPYYLHHMKKVPRELAQLKVSFRVYRQLWGENGEFRVTGELAEWDGASGLSRLPMPTLVLAGRYDQASPEDAARTAKALPKGECMIFARSGHFPFIDQQNLFVAAVEDFLTGT